MTRNVINQKCKGARDLLPEDTQAFHFIEDAFRKSCASWGYREVRTPTLEYMHLFTAAGTLTPSMLSKVYSFLDWDGWSGERVVLRPDGTIPVARLYIENLPQNEVARLFYVTNVFAFEETGTQNREKWQCGVELLGSDKPASDVELVSLAIETLRKLGIEEIQIRLSHAGVLNALLDELKLNSDEEVRLLDKILDGNWQAFTEALPKDSELSHLVSLLLDFTGKTRGFLENVKAMPQLSANLKSALANFAEIAGLLDTLNCRYRIDITSTRGFEYYTGLCFQLSTKGYRIGSGGRYDNLIPLIGGLKTPACGFALYIEPLVELIQPETRKKTESEITVQCKASTAQAIKSTFKLAGALRQAGMAAVLDFDGRRPDKRRTVVVQAKTPFFTIVDPSRNLKKEASSIADVIKNVGGPA